MQFHAQASSSRRSHEVSFSSVATPHPGDRNGEPVEENHGCLIMAALIGALGIVTLIIVLVSVL